MRTVMDLQPRLADAALSRIVNDLRVAGHLGPTAFAELCVRSARVRRLLGVAEGLSRSALEDRFRMFLPAHDLPMPEFNVRLPESGREVDALYRKARVIVELDSWRHHQSRASFERDRENDERAADEGYVTLRITDRGLGERGAVTAARLRRLLERRGGP